MCAWIARSPMSLNYVRHYLSLSRTHMHKGERESSGSSNRCVTYGQPWSNRSSPSSKMTFSHPWARESGGSKFTILPLDAEDRIETTRMSWISTSLHTHPLSPGRLWNHEHDFVCQPWVKPGRVQMPRRVIRELSRTVRLLSTDSVASTVVGPTSPATGARNATRSRLSHGSRWEDEPLTLMHIIQERYTHSEFAFLSARHTAAHSRRGVPSDSRDAVCWIQWDDRDVVEGRRFDRARGSHPFLPGVVQHRSSCSLTSNATTSIP